MQKKGGLIIFVKNAVAGKVKTRLAATIGNEAALKVYHNLLHHTRTTALKASSTNYLFYDQAIEAQDDWSTAHFNKRVQATGDLGDRMNDAFLQVLKQEDKAVIIGSDCPEISESIINEAFDKLTLADVVIGPTHDGGYYLLGMKTLHRSLFDNMEWSTESVYSQTILRIKEKGLLYAVLPQLSDMDNIDDLNKFPSFR